MNNPLIPVRMLNEYVYCPRLAYLMWIQAEFTHNEFTIDGIIKHKRVDMPGKPLYDPLTEDDYIHARSVSLSDEKIGITAKIDIVEGKNNNVIPIDYKRGKRPHISKGAYDPERVQLCAQSLLLREYGFSCTNGVLYFVSSKERVTVDFDYDLEELTRCSIKKLALLAQESTIPEPLQDSTKCSHCSLVGICLPDEIGFLHGTQKTIRPIFPSLEHGTPLYVQSPKAYIRKNGMRLVVEENREVVAEARLEEMSQLALFGNSTLTTPALHECFRREIPVTYLSYGGWFLGHSVSTGHKNVETRTAQYRASFDPTMCLGLARSLVAAKIANCRTLLRRNHRGQDAPKDVLDGLSRDARMARATAGLDSLLGHEGTAASRYFGQFASMLKQDGPESWQFDFVSRNRRPPKDPVNAMLSFAYAMLVREWTVALSAVGLDPYRGFYHQPRFGRPALSLDMMEPFRPIIADSVVITAINNGEVQQDDFIQAVGSCNLTDKGRKAFIHAFERRMNHEITHPIFKYRISYRRLLEVQSRLLARYLTGEIQTYPCFTTR
ncbi:CRISPR-associated endonuclease Cas1 [Desulfovibrionales bacterium]